MNFNKKKLFFIAEIGSNFNQSYELGKKLISNAKNIGANAVKFQIFKASKLYPKDKKMFKIFKKIELSQKQFIYFKKFADKINIPITCSAFDIESAKFLEKCNVKFHKIASSELSNYKLIDFISKTKKPIVLSTGMSDLEDVKKAVEICENNKNYNISILQCTSLYPPNHKSNNLNVLKTFQKNFIYPVGLSDHNLDNVPAITSVGLGARIFEKHFTLSKKMDGPDHFYALEPNEFKLYIKEIKNSLKCLGSEKKNFLIKERIQSRRKSMYFKRDMKKGEIIYKKDIIYMRPPLGIMPNYINHIIKKKIKNNVKAKNPILFKDLK